MTRTKNKKFVGLDDLPKVERDILAGIATELLEIDPALRLIFHKGMGKVRRCYMVDEKDREKAFGVYVKLRKVEIIHVAIYRNVVHAAYEWNGKLIPSTPVPDKPGWVYRARRDDLHDDWKADVQDSDQFQRWMDRAVKLVKERIDYLEGRRRKAAEEKEFRKRQAEIAAECHRRWKERWEKIEANMYVI